MIKLELRVIDLGSNRVVQVVKGEKFFAEQFPFTDADVCIYDRDIDYIKHSFAECLDKLNAEGEYRVEKRRSDYIVVDHKGHNAVPIGHGEGATYFFVTKAQAECDRLNGKHVPRLERDEDGVMTLYFIGQDGNEGVWIRDTVLEAFEQIAGKPFHIHEPKPRYRGMWTLVAPVEIKGHQSPTSDYLQGYNRGVEETREQIAESMSGITIYKYIVEEC